MARGKDYKFEIDDTDFIKKADKIVADLPDFTKYILGRLGLRLLARTKKLTPVDTGLLRRMWHINKPKIEGDEASIEIKNNTVYALPIEMGHIMKNGGFKPGRFMLKRAMDELEPQIPDIVEKEMQNYINKHGGGR